VNEFEQRLAAALREAVAEARPPGRLTELIRRRNRRHRIRVGAVSLTAVAAIALAVPLAAPALTGGRPPVAGQASPSAPPSSPIPTVTTPPKYKLGRSVSEGCSWQIGGAFGKHWQRHSIHVGPVWIIDILWPGSAKDGGGPPRFGDLPIDVRDNAHVRIAVAGPARSYFRLLYGGSGTGGRYTLRDGQLSVGLTGCRPGHDWGIYPGWTQFWGGYYIAKQPACVSLDVWTAAHQRPARVTIPFGAVNCGPVVIPPG
jgi:hypothetical protein